MPQVEFEPTVPAFEWAKTVHALDRMGTVIGISHINTKKYIIIFICGTIYVSIQTPHISRATRRNSLERLKCIWAKML
jgi:hypothetical protein